MTCVVHVVNQARESFNENPLLNPVRNQADWVHIKEDLCALNHQTRSTIPSALLEPTAYHFDGRLKWTTMTLPLDTILTYKYYEASYSNRPLTFIPLLPPPPAEENQPNENSVVSSPTRAE